MKDIGVDIIRISADDENAFTQLPNFREQLTHFKKYPLDHVNQCNGYWHKIAGMSVA